jgi:hypothetical protein
MVIRTFIAVSSLFLFAFCVMPAELLAQPTDYRVYCPRNAQAAYRLATATRTKVRSMIDTERYDRISVRVRLKRLDNPVSPVTRSVEQILNGLTIRQGGTNNLTFLVQGTPDFETRCEYPYSVTVRVSARKKSDNSRVTQSGNSVITITGEMGARIRVAATATPTATPVSQPR